MSNATGVTRGDRRRNARREALRGLVPTTSAIVGIDLGEDSQMIVVTDHDSRVLARRQVTAKAAGLGRWLDWAAGQAADAGFTSVTVACEPTGSRWLHLQDLTAARGLANVCVQPLATHRAREEEDYTRDKSDYKDAVLIARLAGELRCYAPEVCAGQWADLRHLGRRRAELITRESRAVLQCRDLLSLAWPVVLRAAAQPFNSTTWAAALAVVLERCDGDPTRLRRLGLARFTAAVRRELPRWDGVKVRHRIVRAVFTALTDTDGAVTRHRRGALQRAGWAIEDLRAARAGLRTVQAAMGEVLDALKVTDLLATIPGLTLSGAAAILAETGDPTRFPHARSMVKHAGLNPTENTSATFTGRTRTSKRGRPGLRLAAWRGAWGAIRHNPVLAARYTHLTTREDNRLTAGQAHVACAAALLRQIHAVLATGQPWQGAIAAGEQHPHTAPVAA
jgi:transposase